MKKFIMIAILLTGMASVIGCTKENKKTDRGQADDMFRRICELTEEYTDKLEAAPDSADWAVVCDEFEEKLDKINFSYPPDTDLLLTEGQNDTINSLLQEYVKMRTERIDGILHPEPAIDSLMDSIGIAESAAEEKTTDGVQEGASHNPGN